MKYKDMGSYDILTDMGENFTLVHLMDYLVNVNYAISNVGYLITKELLYLIENHWI